MDSKMLAQRHLKVRKALQERRRNPIKLTVLREHAQDSLTSDNDKNLSKNAEISSNCRF